MHEKLNAATAVFFNCKHTLDKIRRNVPEMAGARAALGDLDIKIREIEERMKGLDARITAIGAALPPLPYDACECSTILLYQCTQRVQPMLGTLPWINWM
jgi:hypothetical protein